VASLACLWFIAWWLWRIGHGALKKVGISIPETNPAAELLVGVFRMLWWLWRSLRAVLAKLGRNTDERVRRNASESCSEPLGEPGFSPLPHDEPKFLNDAPVYPPGIRKQAAPKRQPGPASVTAKEAPEAEPLLPSGSKSTPPDFLAAGGTAEALLAEGALEKAEEAFRKVGEQILSGPKVEAVLAGKAALGLMRTRLLRGDVRGAHGVWISKDTPWEAAIIALDEGFLSNNDTALYCFVCAEIHAHGPDQKTALANVNDYMKRVAEYASSYDLGMQYFVARDWLRNLQTIFETSAIPARKRKVFDRWHKRSNIVQEAPRQAALPASEWAVDYSTPATVFYPDGSVRQE